MVDPIEALCRALCVRRGINPDEPWAISDKRGELLKRWNEFRPFAEDFMACWQETIHWRLWNES